MRCEIAVMRLLIVRRKKVISAEVSVRVIFFVRVNWRTLDRSQLEADGTAGEDKAEGDRRAASSSYLAQGKQALANATGTRKLRPGSLLSHAPMWSTTQVVSQYTVSSCQGCRIRALTGTPVFPRLSSSEACGVSVHVHRSVGRSL